MDDLPMFETVWTVTGLTRYVRAMLESDDRLQGIWVTGEVSNVSRPSSGHLYMTLKDDSCTLRCVMWRSGVARQGYIPREGEAIEALGDLSVYEAGGQYQLYLTTLRPAGQGELFRLFMELKARLEAEGLFAPERKRPLPAWPLRIGVVTSPTGAALQDILHVLGRRFPLAEVLVAPTPVQGDGCAEHIVRALRRAVRAGSDVVILARGGGSLEDLWHFNDEALARAIVACSVPVVTGVGHETDFTIADFAADVRAPTPSAAAELVSPDLSETRAVVRALATDLQSRMRAALQQRRWEWGAHQAALQRFSPTARLRSARQRVDDLGARVGIAVRHRLALRREQLRGLALRLEGVSPKAVLARGYALVTDAATGLSIRRVAQAAEGRRIRVDVSDGAFGATIEGS